MAAEGSAEHPVEIIDSEDDEKMDISEPPRRPKEPETIDLCSDDDASEAACTDEDDEAGGALETDQPLEKADEVEDEQPQIRASPWTLEKDVSAVVDKSAAWALYDALRAASKKRLEIDGKTTPAYVRNKQLQQNLPVPQALYIPPPKELDQFVKLLPVLFPYVELYKYGGAYADLAQGRSTNHSHYNDNYFDRSGKCGSQGALVLAWGYKDNPSAIVAENLLISQSNSVNENRAAIGTCEYTEARPGAVYAVPVLPVIEGVAIHTKEDFLQVHQSYYMKNKIEKNKLSPAHERIHRHFRFRGLHNAQSYCALLDCLFNCGLEHKQLRIVLMKKSEKGLNRICKAAKGDVLAKLKAGNPRMEQGKPFVTPLPFRKLHTAYTVSAYKK